MERVTDGKNVNITTSLSKPLAMVNATLDAQITFDENE